MLNPWKIIVLFVLQTICISSLGQYEDTEVLLIFKSDTSIASNGLLNYTKTKWGSSIEYVTNADFFSEESVDELFKSLEDSFPKLQTVVITPLYGRNIYRYPNQNFHSTNKAVLSSMLDIFKDQYLLKIFDRAFITPDFSDSTYGENGRILDYTVQPTEILALIYNYSNSSSSPNEHYSTEYLNAKSQQEVPIHNDKSTILSPMGCESLEVSIENSFGREFFLKGDSRFVKTHNGYYLMGLKDLSISSLDASLSSVLLSKSVFNLNIQLEKNTAESIKSIRLESVISAHFPVGLYRSKNLSSLEVNVFGMDSAFIELDSFQNLKELSLWNCQSLSNDQIQKLLNSTMLSKIETLEITSLPSIESLFDILKHCKKLKKLKLDPSTLYAISHQNTEANFKIHRKWCRYLGNLEEVSISTIYDPDYWNGSTYNSKCGLTYNSLCCFIEELVDMDVKNVDMCLHSEYDVLLYKYCTNVPEYDALVLKMVRSYENEFQNF
jgi:hypothetical protein